MKKFCIVFLFFALGPVVLPAQSVTVEKITALTSREQGSFYFPVMSPDGQHIFFTGPQYRGLFYIKAGTDKIIRLNDEPGAGYNYCFSEDGREVFFRTSHYKGPKRYFSLIKQDIVSSARTVLEKGARELSYPQRSPGGGIVYTQKSILRRTAVPVSPAQNMSSRQNDVAVYIQDRKIVLYQAGQKTELQPLGAGIYIWPSLSPDGRRLVFTKAGQGTYVSDLRGNVLAELGYANAPRWSPDGQWITYMVDHDDGHDFTESDIFITDPNGNQRFRITQTGDIIEMYPNWGADSEHLLFASHQGQIFLAELNIQ